MYITPAFIFVFDLIYENIIYKPDGFFKHSAQYKYNARHVFLLESKSMQ